MGYSDNPSPDYRDTLNHHLHGALEFTKVHWFIEVIWDAADF